jgi:hypothetical protein
VIAFTMNVPVKLAHRDDSSEGAKWISRPRSSRVSATAPTASGFNDDAYRHIFLIPADGGTPRQI